MTCYYVDIAGVVNRVHSNVFRIPSGSDLIGYSGGGSGRSVTEEPGITAPL